MADNLAGSIVDMDGAESTSAEPLISRAMVDAGEATFELFSSSVSPDHLVAAIYKAMHAACHQEQCQE